MWLNLLNAYLFRLGWAFAVVIIMSVAFSMFVTIFNKLVGDINISRELRRKNLAVAIVLAGALIGLSLIIALMK